MSNAAPATAEELTAARLRTLLVRAPTAVAFVSGQSFVVVSEEFNHLFGFGDDSDLGGQGTRGVHTTDMAHSVALHLRRQRQGGLLQKRHPRYAPTANTAKKRPRFRQQTVEKGLKGLKCF